MSGKFNQTVDHRERWEYRKGHCLGYELGFDGQDCPEFGKLTLYTMGVQEGYKWGVKQRYWEAFYECGMDELEE